VCLYNCHVASSWLSLKSTITTLVYFQLRSGQLSFHDMYSQSKVAVRSQLILTITILKLVVLRLRRPPSFELIVTKLSVKNYGNIVASRVCMHQKPKSIIENDVTKKLSCRENCAQCKRMALQFIRTCHAKIEDGR
jgi:hypothetical protein